MTKLVIFGFCLLPAVVACAQGSLHSEAKIYTYAQQMPQFPGGNKALAQLLADSIDLPSVKWEELKDDDLNTSARFSFIVDERGNVSDIKVLRSMNKANDAKLVSVLKKLKFSPALQDGKPVKVLYTLPFNYDIPPR